MIWRILIIIMLHFVVAACSSGPAYQRHANQEQRGKPLIHPMDFPVCPAGEWGTVFVPLGIIVYRGFLPNLEAITELAKQFPESNPCEIIQQTPRRELHIIESKDRWAEGGGGFDMDERGFFVSSYQFKLLNEALLLEDRRELDGYGQNMSADLDRGGRAIERVVESEDVLTINGLEWNHRVVRTYQITEFDWGQAREWVGLHDIYEHHLDESHVFQYKGWYGPLIVVNPELLEDRRQLTRRKLDQFRYEPLSQEQIAYFQTQHHQHVARINQALEPPPQRKSWIERYRERNRAVLLYPADYPLCRNPDMTIATLNILVRSAFIPDPVRVAYMTTHGEGRDPCEFELNRSYSLSALHPVIRLPKRKVRIDTTSGERLKKDVSVYSYELLNAQDLQKELGKQQEQETRRRYDISRFGHHVGNIVEFEEVLTVNGLNWKHQVVSLYDITPHDRVNPIAGEERRERLSLSDIYEHQIDESHVYRIMGTYHQLILDHPILQARRHLTRRLVDEFQIVPVASGHITENSAEGMANPAQGTTED